MATFASKLRTERCLQTSRWVLLEPLYYSSDLLPDLIKVPKGFPTDYASVPRLPLAFLLAGDTAHKSAVVHDWLLESGIVPRPLADKIFLEAMEVEGVAKWRRLLMYAAVRSYTALGAKDLYGKGLSSKEQQEP